MRLLRFDQAEQFYARAEQFLLAHEADHSVILGICADLMRYPKTKGRTMSSVRLSELAVGAVCVNTVLLVAAISGLLGPRFHFEFIAALYLWFLASLVELVLIGCVYGLLIAIRRLRRWISSRTQ